ncbi:hypothetical protein B0T20DRAFT_354586, partial [Sordaria brevicollis]
SSTAVGSVAPLGNTKEDKYYRNDSPYCRHEEKKRKENRNGGREEGVLYPPRGAAPGLCASANFPGLLQFCVGHS